MVKKGDSKKKKNWLSESLKSYLPALLLFVFGGTVIFLECLFGWLIKIKNEKKKNSLCNTS